MRLINIIIILFIYSISVFAQIDNPVFIKADIAFENNKYEQAVKYYTSLIESGINKHDSYIKRGQCYLKNRLVDKALQDFEKAEKLKENSASFYIAACYANNNEVEKSILWLEKYLEGKNKLPINKVKKSPYFKNISNSDKWKELWNNDWYSKNELALNYASYLYKQGELRNALDELDNLLEKRPSIDEAHFLRAKIYNSLKQYKLAVNDCDLAIKYARKNIEYYKYRAENYMALSKYNKALEDVNNAIKYNNNDIELYKTRGIIYYNLKKYEKAKADFNIFLSFIDDDTNALYYQGLTLYSLEDYLNALLSFNKILVINPADLRSFIARGDTYYKTKTFKYADRDYSMALDIDPKNSAIYYKRALTRKALNQKEHACHDLKKAMKLGNYKAEELYYKYCQ